MKKYFYKCFDCGKSYNKDEIEKNLVYLCPGCGKVEKNQPLRGVLTIEYDYESVRKNFRREEFLKLQTGKFWQYDFLSPLEFVNGKMASVDDNLLQRVTLDSNSTLKLSYNGHNFLALDDTRNPTLSFKDRASSLVALKALQMGIKEIATASTGNAGSSLAGICARVGLRSIIFVPKNIPEAKRIQIQSYGADIFLVDGDYDLAFDTCLEISTQKKWYNRNTAYNPLTIEGKKSAAFDLFISTNGNMPDIIFVPTGDGVILSGLYKGLRELKELGWIEKIPSLIAVQADGSNAVVRYLADQKFEYKPANSIADSICAGAPRCLYMAYDAIMKSKGSAVEVTDEEILDAQKFVAQNYGIMLEPSSSSTFAAYKNFVDSNKLNGKRALLLFTGNGLKDTSSLKYWNDTLEPLTPEQIFKKVIQQSE
ncbi:MAG: pyridoxal-phosphate dependent enzyme [Ignavibacteriales bacterium]|nr:pyridoxal-phosphate dependent enzyme [Ignavibacteriales bacterium]